MVSGQKNFHKAFAMASPFFVLRTLCALSAVFFLGFAATASYADNEAAPTATAVKRQAASSQYARAEEQRAALNSKTIEKRTLAEYKETVAGYRRVTLITPRAPEVPDSLLAIAELYTEMGDRFGRSYYQSAVDTYEFLAREYPTSKFCQDALLRAGKLQRNQLGDLAAAMATYDEFVSRYPRSARRREAQEVRKQGMGVISMKLVGEGQFTNRDDRKAAMRRMHRGCGGFAPAPTGKPREW